MVLHRDQLQKRPQVLQSIKGLEFMQGGIVTFCA